MKRSMSVIGIFALMVAMAAGIAVAQGPGGPGGHGREMAFMATALDLTDAQQEQIKQIHASQKTEMQASHRQLKSLHEQFQSLVASDTFDEAKAQALIAQIQQLESAQMLAHARMENAVYKILTPQQKAKFVKLLSTMHGHGGPGGPGGPGADAPPPQEN